MDAAKCGTFIAELRSERGMTQKELSEALNVSDKAISRWETGKGYPDVSSLMALSEFFSVSVNELLSGKRIDIEKLSTTADENVLEVIRKNERINKKTEKTGCDLYAVTYNCYIAGFIYSRKKPFRNFYN